jgi:hypothetical protein
VVNNLTKTISFLKLESDLSNYRKQHITDSLVYSNFKVWTYSFAKFAIVFYLKCTKSYASLALWQSFLLSKALRLQQEGEDQKNDFIITSLENKVEDLKRLLKEKDVRIESTEASLAEAHLLNEKKDTQIAEQNKQIE